MQWYVLQIVPSQTSSSLTLFSYVCSKSVTDYTHFDNHGGKCKLYDNTEERHATEVEAAEKAARAKLREENPNITEEDLQIKVSDRIENEERSRLQNAANEFNNRNRPAGRGPARLRGRIPPPLPPRAVIIPPIPPMPPHIPPIRHIVVPRPPNTAPPPPPPPPPHHMAHPYFDPMMPQAFHPPHGAHFVQNILPQIGQVPLDPAAMIWAPGPAMFGAPLGMPMGDPFGRFNNVANIPPPPMPENLAQPAARPAEEPGRYQGWDY